MYMFIRLIIYVLYYTFIQFSVDIHMYILYILSYKLGKFITMNRLVARFVISKLAVEGTFR